MMVLKQPGLLNGLRSAKTYLCCRDKFPETRVLPWSPQGVERGIQVLSEKLVPCTGKAVYGILLLSHEARRLKPRCSSHNHSHGHGFRGRVISI